MGSSTDFTHTIVNRELKKMYSPDLGWQIERAPEIPGVAIDYQVSRKRFGTKTAYPVCVSLNADVTEGDVAGMVQSVENAASAGINFDQPILFVPTGANVESVPEAIKVKELRAYKVLNGEVVWFRKNA